MAIDLVHHAVQSAKLKVQKYSGVRSDPNPIGPPQQAAGPSGPNGNPNGPHGPAGTTHRLTLLLGPRFSVACWQSFHLGLLVFKTKSTCLLLLLPPICKQDVGHDMHSCHAI